MRANFIFILICVILISSCGYETNSTKNYEDSIVEIKSPCGLCVKLESIDRQITKTSGYETFAISINDENDNIICEGVIEYIEVNGENKAYVYSSIGDLVFTYIDKGDNIEDIIIYDENVTRITSNYQYGFRRIGEKYKDCISRVSDEFILIYEENYHTAIQYIIPQPLIGCASIFLGIVGCRKYENEIL